VICVDKAELDRLTVESEMKELERQISHDRKLRDFMKLKFEERRDDEYLVAYRKRKGQWNDVLSSKVDRCRS
jgi:hypothetical protein